MKSELVNPPPFEAGRKCMPFSPPIAAALAGFLGLFGFPQKPLCAAIFSFDFVDLKVRQNLCALPAFGFDFIDLKVRHNPSAIWMARNGPIKTQALYRKLDTGMLRSKVPLKTGVCRLPV